MAISHMRRLREIEYPDADGKPMAETDVHRDWMFDIIERLKNRFAGRRVYVSGNLLVYYVEGDPTKSFAPDAFVVKKCNPGRRRVFKIWEEKRVPSFVLETTSKKTRAVDRGTKKILYASLGVAEYFLYDPLVEWLDPPLQGFRLKGTDYESIPPDPQGGVVSKELGIRFVLEDADLVMYDVATGEKVLTKQEQANLEEKQRTQDEKQRAQDAEQRAQYEKKRAEQRIKELEEELARLKQQGKKSNGGPRKNGTF